MKRQFRLLPTVIFFAALTLTVKLGALWQDLEVAIFPTAVAEAAAEGKDSADKEKMKSAEAAKAKPSRKPMAKTKDDKEKPGKHSMSGDGEAGKVKSGAEKSAKTDMEFDATQATDAEVEVLQKLASRRKELDQRAREIAMRQSMLGATERRIETRIGELTKIKTLIEGLLRKHSAEQEAKFKSLVKIYESMKPKDAARIFQELDMEVLLGVIERMREAKTAPILANMDAKKAKLVTTALANRGSLPPLATQKTK